MVDINRINPDDPNTLKRILDRLDRLEKQVKELPDSLPPQRGLASATKQGYASKEQIQTLNANNAKLALIPDVRSHVEAYQSATISRAAGNWIDFICDNKTRDTNNEFNIATGVFTSSHAGTFLLAGAMQIVNPPDQSRLFVRVTDPTGATEYFRLQDSTKSGPTAGYSPDVGLNFVVPIYFGTSGGQFKVQFQHNNSTAAVQNTRGGSAFMWLKIREMV